MILLANLLSTMVVKIEVGRYRGRVLIKLALRAHRSTLGSIWDTAVDVHVI